MRSVFLLLISFFSIALFCQTDTVPPVITLKGADTVTIMLYQNYVDSGATAYDVHDGVVAVTKIDSVDVLNIGYFRIWYYAKDAAGNNAIPKKRVVRVKDTIPPVITLRGPKLIFICDTLSTAYTDSGYTVSDNYNKNSVTVSIDFSNLNLRKIGRYIVTFMATDASGNFSVDTRVVKVGQCSLYGYGYYDDNKNCVMDSGEEVHYEYKVVLKHLGSSRITTLYSDYNGTYSAYSLADTGKYMVYVHPLLPSSNLTCIKDSFPIYYTDTSSYRVDLPFVDTINTNIRGYFFNSPRHRFGFANSVLINIRNTRNTLLTNVQCKLAFPSGGLAILYPNISIDSSVNHNLFWHIDTLPAHSNLVFKFPFSADTSIHLNDTITWRFYVKADQTETDTSDNRDVLNMRVVGSYDPNMKTCSQPAVVPAGATTFTYRVDFQNTGTADAINVSVTDTLDPKFDISSLRIKSASHPYELIIRNNILIMKFYFIYLPDSHTNEPGSHGYFTYTLNLKKPLAVTEVVRNTAYIYFDNNAPIVTNTVINQYAKTGIQKTLINTLDVYPNPAQTRVYFPNDNLEKAELMDITGHILMQTGSNIFDISVLPSGLYFIRVGNRTAKLIKE